MTLLSLSALIYLVTRKGALMRFRIHQRVPRALLDEHFADKEDEESITVLIPSYVEEPRVVEKTVWSAALQEFPHLTIALLLDDPPFPSSDENREILARGREIVFSVIEELHPMSARFSQSRADIRRELDGGSFASAAVVSRLADDYRAAARWLENKAGSWRIDDHTDVFFCDQVLRDLARDLMQTEEALNDSIVLQQPLEDSRVVQLSNRLVWIFSAQGLTFERKQYISTPSDSNKAMNLNSFIALMGHSLKKVSTADGTVLRDAARDEAPDLVIRDTPYILTLDADSMLLRDYCLRLVYLLEQPGNERVAVTQTPYSSYRGAPSRIERLAAATTDIQHVLHQGLTYYDATFWVGANAVIRKKALEDIVQISAQGDKIVRTYIQDRTVIEDTESSVDLGMQGWHLVNYPERLSYSATPPDFGSLIVQRRRWANGGLLIVGKFLRQVRMRRNSDHSVRLGEFLLRVNYMVSIAWSSFGLIFLLFYPFDSRLLSLWVIAAAVPYFALMASDLKRNGYHRSDILRIYGFNIVLLTVNLAGTLKSIQQGVTDAKIPFARTPKVENRTASPALYVIMPWLIVVFSCLVLYADILSHNWWNAAFAGFNAVVTTWAIVSLVGVRNSFHDAFWGVIGWFYVPDRPDSRVRNRSLRGERGIGSPVSGPRHLGYNGWRDRLYYGDRDLIHRSRLTEDRP